MSFNAVILYLFYAFVLTAVSGTIFTLFWLLLKRYVGEGHVRLLSRCLRIGAQLYLLPVLFGIVLWRNGDSALFVPWRDKAAMRKMIFEGSDTIYTAVWVLIGLWVIGVAAVLIPQIIPGKKLRDTLSCAVVEDRQNVLDCCEQLRQRFGIHREIYLLRSDATSVPCVVGGRRLRVILPGMTQEYTDRELEVILSHELMHCRRHDLFFKLEFLLINAVHAMNPLTHLMRRYNTEYTEEVCDIEVCEEMQELFTFREYGDVLLAMAVKQNKEEKEPLVGITDKANSLQRRVQRMIRYKNGKRMKKRAAALITALLVAGSSMTAYAAGNGIAKLHKVVYDATIGMVEEENTGIENTLTEYTMSEEEFAQNPGIPMQGSLARSYGNISDTLGGKAKGVTASFHLTEGDKIIITLDVSPSDKDVRVGIAGCPGVNPPYVMGKGAISHTFTAEKTGDYYVFVENMTDASVTVNGFYTY